MNALEVNSYTRTWRALAADIPRPRAILAVSAHWYINATAVTAMAAPRTIHDFYGFPPELFALQYPAVGSPDVAAEVIAAVDPVWVGLDVDSWGIDHGTWSVLAHMYPDADVPVVQLSVNAMQPLEYHLDLGRRLAPLRARDVLVVCSGNVVHNLREINPSLDTRGYVWAERFNTAVQSVMTRKPGTIGSLGDHPDFGRAVPTPDHFLPLVYLAGLADAAGESARTIIDGYVFGSLSMTCYSVGLAWSGQNSVVTDSAGALPDAPSEASNL
jgi:4,5-DOPA dioxygenase extradiol